ncbi:hypothetical protein KY327_00290 [Candidatus Woesearchaeota archaeon]|nr:hypothetical protein [Candidatus Woesearchaeota archaeon]
MKRQIKKAITTAAIAAATALPAKAQSSLELMQTGEEATTRIRPNLFYQLPGGVKGYTFGEFYQGSDAYITKTDLTRELGESLDAKLQATTGAGFTGDVGLGLEYETPTGGKTTAKVKALPVYLGFDGKPVDDKAVLGFYVDHKVYVPLLKDMHVVAFGEVNVGAAGGPQWSYGELHAQKTLDDFVIGLGLDLRGKGDVTPDPKVSVKLGYVLGQH